MPRVREQVLGRAKAGEDQHVRWEPEGISMPAERVRGNRALAGETMKITVVGWLGIAGIMLAAVLLIQQLQKQQNPGPQTNEAPLGN
jgi:hypothetical protein